MDALQIMDLTKGEVEPGQKLGDFTVADENADWYSGWVDDAILCQFGTCRNDGCSTEELVSWAKQVVCPNCGGSARLT